MSTSNLQNIIWNGVDGYSYTPSPDRIYVSSFSSSEVLEVNPSNGQITARIPTNKFPFQSILVNQELISFTLWESTPPYILEKDVQPWIFFLTCPPTVPRNTWHQTNTLTVGGLNVETPVSVPNIYSAQIWKNGVNVGQSTTVLNDDTIYLKLLTPQVAGEKIELPLFIGEGYHYFESTTSEVDNKSTPFEFTDILGADQNTIYTSNTVTISDIDSDVILTATITNGTIVKNNIDTGLSSVSVQLNDTIAIKLSSSPNYSAPVFSRLDVGGESSVWAILTKIDPLDVDPLPTPQNFNSILDAELDTIYESNSYILDANVDLYLEPLVDAELIINGNPVGQFYSALIGDSVAVRLKSSLEYKTTKSVKIFGRAFVSEFSIETLSDTSINYLTWDTNHYVPLNGRTISNDLVVSGLSSGESVELELTSLNIIEPYFINKMDVRFFKNGIDVESNFVTVQNGDILSVSAFVTGASWNGFVQEFKVYQVNRIYDEETNELLEIQRTSEVGFWRYVTAYLVGVYRRPQKEIPILINHTYELVKTYSHFNEVIIEGIKPYISIVEVSRGVEKAVYPTHEISRDVIVNTTHHSKTTSEILPEIVKHTKSTVSIDYVASTQHIEDISVSYETSHKNQVTINADYVVSGVTKATQDTSFIRNSTTKATQDTSFISGGVTKFEQEVDYVVSGVTKATQDTSFISGGVTKATQDTSFIRNSTSKATQDVDYVVRKQSKNSVDVDYFKREKHIILVDDPEESRQPLHVSNLSKHLLNSPSFDVSKKRVESIDASYEAIHKNSYLISSDYIYTSFTRFLESAPAEYEFISGVASSGEFSSTIKVVSRNERLISSDYLKERYYHHRTIDADYSLGLHKKLYETEDLYTFHHSGGNSINISPEIVKLGTLGDINVDHNYEKTGWSSHLSPTSEYHQHGFGGVKLFESSNVVHTRSSRDVDTSYTRKSIQVNTVGVEYSVPGRTIRDFSTEVGITRRSEEINISTEFIVNNSHAQALVETSAIISKKQHREIGLDVTLNNNPSRRSVSVEYVAVSPSSHISEPVSFEVRKHSNIVEIERNAVEIVGSSSKTIDFSPTERVPYSVFAISRGVEVVSAYHHGEEIYNDEEFRAFDTPEDAILYAQNLGTIVNPKAMRLASGKWFYYGDAEIQNASCKIGYPYPKFGYLHGG